MLGHCNASVLIEQQVREAYLATGFGGTKFFFVKWVPVHLQNRLNRKKIIRYLGTDITVAKRKKKQLLMATAELFKALS